MYESGRHERSIEPAANCVKATRAPGRVPDGSHGVGSNSRETTKGRTRGPPRPAPGPAARYDSGSDGNRTSSEARGNAMPLLDLRSQSLRRAPDQLIQHLKTFELDLRFSAGIWF